MPAENGTNDVTPPPPRTDEDNSADNGEQLPLEQAEQVPNDSDGSDSSNMGDEDEFITINLAELRKEVQCPICLGIIRKTRTVMECLHRFCRECIDKSMRLGNNECPTCRTHCASRRSLRDDPNYDALIAALYPDIDKYEEEESAFHEEEKARNKQIQASIAETLRRQSEALGKKRPNARDAATESGRRSQRYRNLRGRRNQRASGLQGFDDEEDDNGHDGGKDSSSADEQVIEVKPKRYKRSAGAQLSHTSATPGTADGGSNENDSEVPRDPMGAPAGVVPDILAWGGGGIRSNSRHNSAGSGKNARSARLSKLIDSLQKSAENDELDIHLMLVSLDERRLPSLQFPDLHFKPNLSIKHLCQYVALKTAVNADEVEMLLVKEIHSEPDPTAFSNGSVSACKTIDPCKDELHILDEHETLAELQTMHNSNRSHLLLAYRKKFSDSVDSS